jgi:hypothetical protein
MTRRRAFIKKREVVFLGCEGESERSYAQLLNDEIRLRDLPYHIQAEPLSPGAGDPLSRLKKASKLVAKANSPFLYRAILLDIDQVENNQARFNGVLELARTSDIQIIWQRPCHEAFLLRHFAGHEHSNPANSAMSEQKLMRIWPEYRKPMTKIELSKRITAAELERVSALHPEFAALLRMVRLIP